MVHRKRTTCRACSESQLRCFLSFGSVPLANSFPRSPAEFFDEPVYPLDVYFCDRCSLVQLADVIDPEVLFRNYIYVTGTSDTMASHNRRYAATLVDSLNLGDRDLVVEIASNDGSLLRCLQQHGVRTLGIEPASNIAAIASASGVETLNQFFNSSTAQQVRESHGPAKVVIANNVLAHVDDTRDFLLGCKQLLEEDGHVIIEVPYLRDLLDQVEYDTIYHEHLCYFSATTLIRLCDTIGLSILRADRLRVHGGSLRIYARPQDRCGGHSKDLPAVADQERAAGLTAFTRYERFAADVQNHRLALLDLLETLNKDGRTVVGYGAPAKGNTLLNYCGIDTRLIPYTVDKNPMKVGLYTPGMHIPILPVSTLLDHQPDYVLILAWNLSNEIMAQQQEYRDRGGRFIIPLPTPKVL
ncbi:MAG: class I SAM-dependent methyltransferase [Candidatus Rokubacteria bacterium]|nr:class I SAM-dependent methyltransferase [Candidatus Rokubacteria bacterium]